ncbi:MAG: ABC-2 transporter permease [Ruminiclostridium sp.]|nr:ABC-2 transporter permease [Ruminiclostridium sp.]
MKALLYKDFLVLWKQMKFVLFMVAIFCVMPDTGFSLNTFFVAYAGMLVPVTLFAYDERAKWDALAAMMPFTTWDLVLSRYVFAWLATAYAVFWYLLGYILLRGGITGESMVVLGAILTLLLAIQAIYFPILFRLGAEKGRMLLFVVIIGLMVLVAGATAVLEKLAISPSPLLFLGCFLAAVTMCIGSVKVSVKQYEQRTW